ncbi:PREDICTED: 39S ribosomal protein L52, mitochondrial-like [Amphimedon queenslandica]|uniref:Large ribosomal subunit protein mL52 n=1 Tax=Amphimedon queenslandica TaxID=400682 RepID=A0AAN0J332_AMPQE|nr:PREDICTED: 39S ribosomal protein L52, mitochondrial-like [Amphimedon queenslandica]|eukprot:XP_019851415.1 PREDICTED: 39S ribosomal protein L52, mitochondrial-like [Amphimedon queenslandica]
MAVSIKAQRTFPQFISRVNAAMIHTGGLAMVRGNWREKMGMSRTGTSYGPLTDIPDWSYVDGRPSPVTVKRQTKRKLRLNFLNKRVKTLLKEVDLAKFESKTKRRV